MVFAHQNLDQLAAGLRASIMASTTIKFAGGVSCQGRAGASPRTCGASRSSCRSRRKRAKHTEFACWVKNLTPQAIGVTVPLGYVDSQPTLSEDDFQFLIERNRERYCAPIEPVTLPPPSLPPVAPAPVTPADVPLRRRAKPADAPLPPLGRGGRQHQYLQHLLKQMAEERGYRAVIEEPILEGAGRVDVSLSKGDTRIACEISVNTKGDQELGNIEKCIAAGYAQVILVAPEQRHLNTMRKFIGGHLEAEETEKVQYLLPDEFMAYLDGVRATGEATEEMVRGYKVKVAHRVVSEADAEARRKAISLVLARSLGRLKSDR